MVTQAQFRIRKRVDDFRGHLRDADYRSPRFLGFGAGWLAAFLLMMANLYLDFFPGFLLLGLYFYLWYQFRIELQEALSPLPEALLLLFYGLSLLQFGLIRYLIPDIPGDPLATSPLLDMLQLLLLALQLLIFSQLLVQQDRGKAGLVAVLFLLGIFFDNILLEEKGLLYFGFQLLLLAMLLDRTRWLEELTRLECWIYLVISVVLLNYWWQLDPFADIDRSVFQKRWYWQTAPAYLHLVFKYYLLALAIKIPIVIVYNHASLSRKLRISGLFQSTFPQLIQLIALLLIFYFFLSGWQAQYLQHSVKEVLTAAEREDSNAVLNQYHFRLADSSDLVIRADGYQPFGGARKLPLRGVLELKRLPPPETSPDSVGSDYFFFHRELRGDTLHLDLVLIDSLFLTTVSRHLRLLAGTALSAYPLIPDAWSTWAYRLRFFDNDKYIRAFYFGMFPYRTDSPTTIRLQSGTIDSGVKVVTGDLNYMTLGRTFSDIWINGEKTGRYLSTDIILDLRSGLLWGGVGIVLLFMGLIYLFFNSLVIRRVIKVGAQINQIVVQKFNQLKQGIQEVSSGNLDYKIEFGGEDEFVELARHFNQMGERLKATIAEAREKERLAFELQSAREVQLSLLPRRLPDIPGYRIAAGLHTATEVGGDFYDVFPLSEERYLITIGDVSGKGSSAALYMAQCISLIRFSCQFTTDPKKIAAQLNAYFSGATVDRHIFITAIIGVLDIRLHRFSYIRAGHTLPIRVPHQSDKKLEFLNTRGLGIGLTGNEAIFQKQMEIKQVTLESKDRLLLYTDGLIEASRPAAAAVEPRTSFDEEALVAVLSRVRHQNVLEIQQEIEAVLTQFYDGHAPVDDYTLLILQRA